MPRPQLFHVIADPASARVRHLVLARGLEERVEFRNVHFPEARADLAARGGAAVPALWDGERLVEGEAAIAAVLEGLAGR